MWATIEVSKDANGYTVGDWSFVSRAVGRVVIEHEHETRAYITPAAARELALMLTALADEVESGDGG